MVVAGKFKVEVVYAETKIPFKEHTATTDGDTYVEVEPDAEYFVDIESKSEDPVVAYIRIDGKDLGYNVTLRKKQNYLSGLVSKDELGGTSKQALKFVKINVFHKSEGDRFAARMWTGTVEVDFYEGIPHVLESSSSSNQSRAFSSTWEGRTSDVGFTLGVSNPDKKKGVMSAAGNTVEYTAPTTNSGSGSRGKTIIFKKGGLLKSVSLKYCSTLGLIYAGILSKPPQWDLHRMTYPAPQRDHTENMDSTGAIDLC